MVDTAMPLGQMLDLPTQAKRHVSRQSSSGNFFLSPWG